MIEQQIHGYKMARISEVYLSTLSSIMKPHGIDRYFAPLVYLCENSGKLTQKDLAAALKKDKVSTMRIVDYLSEKGLLVRTQDCNDRRCQILVVTEKAKQLIPQINEGIKQTNDLLLKSFNPNEKKFFEDGLNKLFNEINQFPEPDFIVNAYKRNKNS